MRSTNAHDREWFSHYGHRTFELADRLYGMALAGLPTVARIRDEERETEFIASWPRDTLVHRLARMSAHDMFYDEADAKPSTWDIHSKTTAGEYRTVHYMSVTVALLNYRLERIQDSFEVPSTPDARDICHDHFVNDVMWSAPYEQLLQKMADEVFHAIFPYRTMLYNLNWIAATFISELDAEMWHGTRGSQAFRAAGATQTQNDPRVGAASSLLSGSRALYLLQARPDRADARDVQGELRPHGSSRRGWVERRHQPSIAL